MRLVIHTAWYSKSGDTMMLSSDISGGQMNKLVGVYVEYLPVHGYLAFPSFAECQKVHVRINVIGHAQQLHVVDNNEVVVHVVGCNFEVVRLLTQENLCFGCSISLHCVE